MTKRIAIYTRVSQDSQTTENQRRELITVAEKNGWEIVAEFTDHGISGAKGRDKRPGYDALMKAVARREIDLVANPIKFSNSTIEYDAAPPTLNQHRDYILKEVLQLSKEEYVRLASDAPVKADSAV